MRGFDQSYERLLTDHVRVRFGYDSERGNITRFLIQLEYRMADGWTPIVRSDHNPPAVYGHDVEFEGVHMDLYRDGKKVEERKIGPTMPASAALNTAEEHLIGQSEEHITRFEQWHNLNRNNDR